MAPLPIQSLWWGEQKDSIKKGMEEDAGQEAEGATLLETVPLPDK